MSDEATTTIDAVYRLRQRDPTLRRIMIIDKQHTNAELLELVNCLLANPNIVVRLGVDFNRLTDETGVKLARYLASSSTLESLGLNNNEFGEATYLAVAAALRVNTSLQGLSLRHNRAVDTKKIDRAFIDALRVNPRRPSGSLWWLYSPRKNDFLRLSALAKGGPIRIPVGDRVQHLERLLGERDQLIASMRAQIGNLHAKFQASQNQCSQLQDQIQECQAKSDAFVNSERIAHAEVQSLQLELNSERQSKVALQAQLISSQAQLSEITAQLGQLTAERQESATQVKQMQFDIANLKNERDRLLAGSNQTISAASSSSCLLDAWTYPLGSVHIDQEAPVTLGEGALGSVALKRLHFMDDSPAAVAAMGGSLSAEDRRAVLEQFMKECRTNARLRHPHIVAFLGLVADDGVPRYLMLEHMAGGTLHDLVYSPGELMVEKLHSILLGVCKALHYLHSLQPAVLHLDVKPKNVLLDGDKAKLADLGEAHIIRSTATITRQGTLSPHGVGTLDYMAPEMHIGSAVKTGKVDMFSFGVMAAECAARKLPEPLEMIQEVDDRRVVLIEEERRAADIAAVDAERWPHVRELVGHLIVDRTANRWTAGQALEFLMRVQE